MHKNALKMTQGLKLLDTYFLFLENELYGSSKQDGGP